MGIVITDQRIEYHLVEQAQDLRRVRTRDAANQFEALRQIGATFVLVFHFRWHTQSLTEVLLMKPLPVTLCIHDPVVALNQ